MVSPSNEIPKSSRKKVGESKSQSYSPKATVQTVEPLIPIKEAKISNQVQCPNCGGYKIDGSVRRIDPETGRAVRGKSGAGCFWFAGITGLGVILSVMSRDTNGVLAIAGFVLGFIAAWVSDAISKQKVKQAIARAYNLYNYSCNLCGYRWEWRDGQPWPKVKVNPDLIAKGAQKLEEETREAEEERKRQEALYHLSKLGKK